MPESRSENNNNYQTARIMYKVSWKSNSEHFCHPCKIWMFLKTNSILHKLPSRHNYKTEILFILPLITEELSYNSEQGTVLGTSGIISKRVSLVMYFTLHHNTDPSETCEIIRICKQQVVHQVLTNAARRIKFVGESLLLTCSAISTMMLRTNAQLINQWLQP